MLVFVLRRGRWRRCCLRRWRVASFTPSRKLRAQQAQACCVPADPRLRVQYTRILHCLVEPLMEEGANASCDSPALPRNPRLEQASLLAGGGSGLVDLLIARRRGRRVHRDVRAYLLHLEVGVPIPVPIEAPVAVEVVVLIKLYDVDYVLGIAGVRNPLDTCALVRVMATASYLKGLFYLATLAFLLGLLLDIVR